MTLIITKPDPVKRKAVDVFDRMKRRRRRPLKTAVKARLRRWRRRISKRAADEFRQRTGTGTVATARRRAGGGATVRQHVRKGRVVRQHRRHR